MIEEKLDILDENGNLTGEIENKVTAHKKGLWHQAVHIWIFNSKGDILFQKRAMKVAYWPGMWDISSAGHISAGETADQTVVRELEEELGLKVKLSDLKKIGTRKRKMNLPEKEYYNNEHDHVFILRLDDISKIIFKDGEVEDIKFVPIEQLTKDIEDPEESKKYVPRKKYYYDIMNIIKKELSK